ncbi:MAG: hypothetical protein ACJ8DC_00385 [Gemmatimonadales bacterium]
MRLPLLGLVALLGGGAGGCSQPCNCDATESAAGTAKVVSLETELEGVQITPPKLPQTDRKFLLYGWYRDAAGTIVAGRFPSMRWSFKPTAEGSADDFGKVTVTTFPTTGSTTATAEAQKADDATLTDQVTLTRWANEAAATSKGDVVEAEHRPGDPPNVVLLEEQSSGTCHWGAARAFVGGAEVGEQTQDPCSLSLLSSSHAMLFQRAFSPSLAGTGARAQLSLGPPRQLELRVFIAVTGRTPSILSGMQLTSTPQLIADVAADAEAQAKVDVDLASSVFELNRVGIQLKATYKTLSPTTPDLSKLVGAHPFDCAAPRSLPKNPLKTDYAYEENAVSVYYVDWIDFPTDPLHPGSRGIQCHYWFTGTPGPVVYVSYTRHSPITLAHELGHVLGLNDEGDALGTINVMHNLAPDGPLGANARNHLSVGQVVRMNIWNDSWITTGTTVPPTRACDALAPCPPTALDVH